jgi:hypothetical protein
MDSHSPNSPGMDYFVPGNFNPAVAWIKIISTFVGTKIRYKAN